MGGGEAIGAQNSNAGAWGSERPTGHHGLSEEVAAEEKPVSLLGRWFPGDNKGFRERKAAAGFLRMKLFLYC